jgi:hypothetical protein
MRHLARLAANATTSVGFRTILSREFSPKNAEWFIISPTSFHRLWSSGQPHRLRDSSEFTPNQRGYPARPLFRWFTQPAGSAMLRLVCDWLVSVWIGKVHPMAIRFGRELGLIIAWLVFPLVPVVLADAYYQVCALNLTSNARFGPDPRDWGWFLWVLMLGPLAGYGFLAGATVDLPDDVGSRRTGWRGLGARRSVWVAIGPWWGFLIWISLFSCYGFLLNHFPSLGRLDLSEWLKGTWFGPLVSRLLESLQGTWFESILGWVLGAFAIVTFSYAWLWPARAALRRAAQVGRLSRAFYRGLSIALAFVGSLFGSFWAATSWWRSYFFDPRLMPLIVVAVGLAVTSGCTSTITYGEIRRRELFHAMLVSWVLGLALMWRWWSRRRPRPPNNGASA